MVVNQGLLNSLTDAERLLVGETERDALKGLDEDELLDLHQRIRRTRTKYAKLYRRGASAKVQDAGGRGMAYPTNQRNRDKAELFESVLARVSREVAVAANRASRELRRERIEASRSARAAAPAVAGGKRPESKLAATGAVETTDVRKTAKTTGGLKKDASTRALGARRQVKRDTRRAGATSGSG